MSGASGQQGPEAERYQRVPAVVEGASATPGIRREWCHPLGCVGLSCLALAPLVGSGPGQPREAAMMSFKASRGQPRGCEAAGRPRHAAGSLPAPRLGGVRAALEPGAQRPQPAGDGLRDPRAPDEMWSSCSPRTTPVSGVRRLGAGKPDNPGEEAKPDTHRDVAI